MSHPEETGAPRGRDLLSQVSAKLGSNSDSQEPRAHAHAPYLALMGAPSPSFLTACLGVLSSSLPWLCAAVLDFFILNQRIDCFQASLEACRCVTAPILAVAGPLRVLQWPLC